MSHELTAQAERSFRDAASVLKGFRHRPGQQHLVRAIAETLAAADFSDNDGTRGRPEVLVAEAGTGTGKTIAYVLSALPIARARDVKLVISTATVNLMEQLHNKDLPALAKVYPGGFTFGLAKGRGRYLCLQKLDHRLESTGQGTLQLDENDPTAAPEESDSGKPVAIYGRLSDAYRGKRWNGERDSLDEDISGGDWAAVAADRVSCSGRNCSHFMDCPYYVNARKLAKSDVIVTNHDLLISTVVHGGRALPGPEKAIYVIDEAHHLPSVAMAQSELSTELSSPSWVPALARACRLSASAGNVSARVHPELPGQVQEAMRNMERMARDFLRLEGGRMGEVLRFERGDVHSALNDLAMQLMHACAAWSAQSHTLLDEVKDLRSAAGDSASRRVDAIFIELAQNVTRLDELLEVLRLFVNDAPAKAAKWLAVKVGQQRQEFVRLHVCPLTAAPTLRRFLWSRVRGAVLTSATIRTLNSFDYFLREAGLRQINPRTEAVESPFDYGRQGTIIVSHTPASPQGANQEQFVRAMTPQLIADLEQVRHGALALFSSKRLMEQVVAALPPEVKRRTLVQGSKPRDELLKKHRERVHKGKPSILFGMASFGDGLDLPGIECQHVMIPKIPFSMPTDPVEEARAEWVVERGGNPFMSLSVPATGMQLTQWVGRGIRTEDDQATIIFYDPRLVEKAYGKQLLNGLPAFARKLRTKDGALSPLA